MTTMLLPTRAGARAGAPVTVSALPAPVNLLVWQGDDTFLDVVVTDAGGQPLDLTGYVPLCQIRATAAATTIMAELDGTIAGNTVHLHLTHAQATGLLPGPAVWDCQITDPTGRVTTLCAGTVTVSAEVTR